MVPIVLKVGGTSVHAPARTGLYAVKAVSTRDVFSTNPAFLSANVYGLSINVIETIAGDPDWVGSFYRVKEDESRSALVLISAVDLFSKDDLFDWTDLLAPFSVYAYGYFEWPVLDLSLIHI